MVSDSMPMQYARSFHHGVEADVFYRMHVVDGERSRV
jgi:hypothetical protein